MSKLILLENYQKNKINWLSMYIVLVEDLKNEINEVLSKDSFLNTSVIVNNYFVLRWQL